MAAGADSQPAGTGRAAPPPSASPVAPSAVGASSAASCSKTQGRLPFSAVRSYSFVVFGPGEPHLDPVRLDRDALRAAPRDAPSRGSTGTATPVSRAVRPELTARGASTQANQLAGGWKDPAMVVRYAASVSTREGAVSRYLRSSGR